MKTKFLIKSKLVVFFLLLFTFSCQVEEDFITQSNVNQSKSFSSDYISLDNFQRNKQSAFKEFQSIKKKSLETESTDLNARLEFNNEYNFFIDTKKILFTEQNDYHSFTFRVFKLNSTTTDNLVLTYNTKTNSYDSYLVSYEFNENEKQILASNGYVPLETKSTFTPLNTPANGDPVSGVIYVANGICYGYVRIKQEQEGENGVAHIFYTVEIQAIPCNGELGGVGADESYEYIDYQYDGSINNNPNEPDISSNGGGGFTSDNIPNSVLITAPVLDLPNEQDNIESIQFYNDLSLQQKQWVYFNTNTYDQIIYFLVEKNWTYESKVFAMELMDLAILETNQEDVYKITSLSIMFETSEDIFSEEFGQSLLPFTEINPSHLPPDYPLTHLSISTFLKYKQLRQLNPDWSRAKCLWYATKEMVHISLDVFGMIPLIGEPADILNGVLYTISGEKLNATLSFAGAVPLTGWAATGVKYAIKINEVATIGTKIKLVWKVGASGVIQFGSRNQLRKVLGITASNIQAHHIIPWAKQTHPAIQKAAKSGNAFHMNEALNGIPLSTAVHNGSHAHYDNLVQIRLNAIPTNATPQQAYNQIVDLINDIRIAIANNPNTPINQLNF